MKRRRAKPRRPACIRGRAHQCVSVKTGRPYAGSGSEVKVQKAGAVGERVALLRRRCAGRARRCGPGSGRSGRSGRGGGGRIRDALVAELGELDQRAVLVGEILAVHQRHQQELTPRRRGIAASQPRSSASMRQLERQRVGGERLGRAAEDVAAELVEQDDRGEQMVAGRRATPSARLATTRRASAANRAAIARRGRRPWRTSARCRPRRTRKSSTARAASAGAMWTGIARAP